MRDPHDRLHVPRRAVRRDRRRAAINAKIRYLQKQDSRQYQVVDWDAAIHAPGGVQTLMEYGTNLNDGVHENTGAGARWFADEYAEALSLCPDPVRP